MRCLPAALVLLAAGCSDRPQATEPAADEPRASAAPEDDSRIVPDHYIVRFRDEVGDPDALAKRLAGEANGRLRHVYSDAIKGFAAVLPEHAAEALRKNPNVVSVSPDVRGTLDSSPQSYPGWGLDRIDQAGRALNNYYYYDNTGAGVDVYILDSGISQSHPEFSGRIKKSYVTANGHTGLEDCNGHGSSVASIAAGANYGVAKGASIIPVRVNGCNSTLLLSDVIRGIDWVKADHVGSNPAVANMSFSFPDYLYGEENLENAVRALVADGVTVTASAGNGDYYLDPTGYTENGDDACGQSPADVREVITVSATDRGDRRPGWANYGSCVDIFAPGVEVSSAWKNGGAVTISGTSQAAPYVAGTAALYLQQYPSSSPAQVWGALQQSATANFVSNQRGSPNYMLYSRVPGPPRASIVGPASVNPIDSCTWDASVKAGAGPFTYTWRWEGAVVGTGASLIFAPSQSGYLELIVKDARNRTSAPHIYVTVSSSQLPGCW